MHSVTATRIARLQLHELPGFRLTRGLVTLVNDNHVDSYLRGNVGVCILWLSCKQSTQKKVRETLKCIQSL